MKRENQALRETQSGRLTPELLERFIVFSERVLRVCEKLEADRRPGRIISQLVGAGTSPAPRCTKPTPR